MTRRMHTTVKVVVSIHLTVLVVVGCRPERSSQHAVSSKAKQTHDVAVTSVSVPSMCVQGESSPLRSRLRTKAIRARAEHSPCFRRGKLVPANAGSVCSCYAALRRVAIVPVSCYVAVHPS